jgi:hypothetical protein
MRRPTVKQLTIIRGVVGNGWGDGDYLEYCFTPNSRRQCIRAIKAFEEWLEHLQGAQFINPTIGNKRV